MAADGRCGYIGIFDGIQEVMRAEIERCMELWGSAGQADAVPAGEFFTGSSTTEVQPSGLAALTSIRPSCPPPISPMRAMG